MSEVSIETTQNVRVNYQIAELGDRILGQVIDVSMKAVYTIIILIIYSKFRFLQEYWFLVFILFMFPAFYSLLTEYFLNGQTFGKMVAKTKVIKLDGGEAGLGNYILRWLFKIIDDNVFIGMIVIGVSQKGQRVGDIVAGTTVIKLKKNQSYTQILPEIPDDYQIVFQEVAKLSDSDYNIIRDAYSKAYLSLNYVILDGLARRIKDVLGIKTDMKDTDFIRTILKDYNFYHSDPFNTFANREKGGNY